MKAPHSKPRVDPRERGRDRYGQRPETPTERRRRLLRFQLRASRDRVQRGEPPGFG